MVIRIKQRGKIRIYKVISTRNVSTQSGSMELSQYVNVEEVVNTSSIVKINGVLVDPRISSDQLAVLLDTHHKAMSNQVIVGSIEVINKERIKVEYLYTTTTKYSTYPSNGCSDLILNRIFNSDFYVAKIHYLQDNLMGIISHMEMLFTGLDVYLSKFNNLCGLNKGMIGIKDLSGNFFHECPKFTIDQISSIITSSSTFY